MMKQECIFSFSTTHDAMRAEKLLLEQTIAVRVMPLPQAIRSGCGIALRAEPSDQEMIEIALTSQGIEFQVYFVDWSTGKPVYRDK